MTARAATLRSTLNLALRLDLRSLRLMLAVVAIALGMMASAPHGASAKPAQGGSQTTAGGQTTGSGVERTMASAQKACTDAGGTWTVEGSTAYCKGIGNGGDYSCNLKIGPDACSHLPRYMAAARATQGGSTTPTATPMPTISVDASGAASEMSPLDK